MQHGLLRYRIGKSVVIGKENVSIFPGFDNMRKTTFFPFDYKDTSYERFLWDKFWECYKTHTNEKLLKHN